MVANKFLLKITSDKDFILALRRAAIDFIAACEVKLEIPPHKSALYNKRLKVNDNQDS